MNRTGSNIVWTVAAGFLLLLLLSTAHAATIRGEVLSKTTSKPISDANIQIQTYSIQTQSDENGSFLLELQQAGTYRLEVSHISYEPYRIDLDVSGQDIRIVVPMAERVYITDEVVVTATRTPYLLKDVPIATDVIKRDEISRTGATTVDRALESMTGVNVDQGFSGAGDDSLSGIFTVTYVDTIFLCEHNIYRLESQKGIEFMLLSEKHSGERLTAKDAEYETIHDGKTFNLTLTEFDSLLIIEQCFTTSHIDEYLVHREYYSEGTSNDSDTGIVFWRNDTICTKAYWSPQIYDKYYVGEEYLIPGNSGIE